MTCIYCRHQFSLHPIVASESLSPLFDSVGASTWHIQRIVHYFHCMTHRLHRRDTRSCVHALFCVKRRTGKTERNIRQDHVHEHLILQRVSDARAHHPKSAAHDVHIASSPERRQTDVLQDRIYATAQNTPGTRRYSYGNAQQVGGGRLFLALALENEHERRIGRFRARRAPLLVDHVAPAGASRELLREPGVLVRAALPSAARGGCWLHNGLWRLRGCAPVLREAHGRGDGRARARLPERAELGLGLGLRVLESVDLQAEAVDALLQPRRVCGLEAWRRAPLAGAVRQLLGRVGDGGVDKDGLQRRHEGVALSRRLRHQVEVARRRDDREAALLVQLERLVAKGTHGDGAVALLPPLHLLKDARLGAVGNRRDGAHRDGLGRRLRRKRAQLLSFLGLLALGHRRAHLVHVDARPAHVLHVGREPNVAPVRLVRRGARARLLRELERVEANLQLQRRRDQRALQTLDANHAPRRLHLPRCRHHEQVRLARRSAAQDGLRSHERRPAARVPARKAHAQREAAHHRLQQRRRPEVAVLAPGVLDGAHGAQAARVAHERRPPPRRGGDRCALGDGAARGALDGDRAPPLLFIGAPPQPAAHGLLHAGRRALAHEPHDVGAAQRAVGVHLRDDDAEARDGAERGAPREATLLPALSCHGARHPPVQHLDNVALALVELELHAQDHGGGDALVAGHGRAAQLVERHRRARLEKDARLAQTILGKVDVVGAADRLAKGARRQRVERFVL
eukprot:6205004-Pleurochrysis_carterae.AAC.2